MCETIFCHVWLGGQDAADAARLATLRAQLAPAQDPGSEEVKAQLKTNTSRAIAAGIFGVPAMLVDDKVFWGLDALPMLRDYLSGGAWFAAGHWDAASKVPVGTARSASASRSA